MFEYAGEGEAGTGPRREDEVGQGVGWCRRMRRGIIQQRTVNRKEIKKVDSRQKLCDGRAARGCPPYLLLHLILVFVMLTCSCVHTRLLHRRHDREQE